MKLSASQSVLDEVRSLLPAIGEAAAEVDRNGAVDPQIIAQLHEVGYFGLLRPRAFDGLDAEPDEYLTATRELSSACTSTGWLAGWLAVNNWGLALRHERAQQEIWGSDPRTLLCSSYAPTGRVVRVDGGFWLTGRWNRCTGAQHASWLNAAALLVGPDGAAQELVAVLAPRTDYTVEANWNGLGLRGIGADDVVITGAFVPEYRTYSWLNPSSGFDVAPLYQLPMPTLYTLAGTIPLLGAAQRVLAPHRQDGATDALSPIAMAVADVELSVLQIRRSIGDLMDCLRAGRYPDTDLVLRMRRDQVMASERSADAIRAIRRSPVNGVDEDLLELVWRDVHTARIHVASKVKQVLSVVGRSALGLEVDDLIW